MRFKLKTTDKHEAIIRCDAVDEVCNSTDYRFSIKWDGCVDVQRLFTGEDDSDYIHICELRRFIETLEGVEKLAKEHFKEWPG